MQTWFCLSESRNVDSHMRLCPVALRPGPYDSESTRRGTVSRGSARRLSSLCVEEALVGLHEPLPRAAGGHQAENHADDVPHDGDRRGEEHRPADSHEVQRGEHGVDAERGEPILALPDVQTD